MIGATAILGAALALLALLAAAGPALAAPPAPERPYSCRLLDDAARKCAFGRSREISVRFDRRHGKGSHGTLHYGNRKTTLKDLRQEIGIGLLHTMLAQLGLSRRDLDE